MLQLFSIYTDVLFFPMTVKFVRHIVCAISRASQLCDCWCQQLNVCCLTQSVCTRDNSVQTHELPQDFETDSDAMGEIPSSPARKPVSRSSPALRRISPESPASGDSAQEGLPNLARRALRPAPPRHTSSPEPEAAQPKKKKLEGKKAEGKKKAGGPCAVCFHTSRFCCSSCIQRPKR